MKLLSGLNLAWNEGIIICVEWTRARLMADFRRIHRARRLQASGTFTSATYICARPSDLSNYKSNFACQLGNASTWCNCAICSQAWTLNPFKIRKNNELRYCVFFLLFVRKIILNQKHMLSNWQNKVESMHESCSCTCNLLNKNGERMHAAGHCDDNTIYTSCPFYGHLHLDSLRRASWLLESPPLDWCLIHKNTHRIGTASVAHAQFASHTRYTYRRCMCTVQRQWWCTDSQMAAPETTTISHWAMAMLLHIAG